MQRPRRVSPRLALAAFVAAYGLLALHTRRYLPFLADDALISLRYAKRLLEGQGLTWNAGERVEGYSNLLWLLLSAALGWLGLDLVEAVRVLGFVCAGATLGAFLYAYPPRSPKAALPAASALLFLSLSGSFAAWTIGGMEQPLVAALLVWAVVLTYPLLEERGAGFGAALGPGLLFALLCLTRLDGPLFAALATGVVFLSNATRESFGESLRRAAGLVLLPVLAVLLQQGFRVLYYGEWIPNTALAKFNPSGQHALDGWGYVRAGLLCVAPLFALAATAAFVSFRFNFRRWRATLLVALALGWLFYLIAIGGDIFPAWRHFVPLLVLFALLMAEGFEWVVERAGRREYKFAVAAGLLSLILFVALQFHDAENYRAVTERWEWDGQVIGTLFKRAFAEEQPLMAVDPAGCLPYWSELPTVDMLGLNDYHLPRHPPPNFGAGPIAHELGDGRYVLGREPDLVVFLLPTGAEHGYFLSGRQMQRDPRFFRDYTLVRFEGREPYRVVSHVWVRRHSGRIGIRRTSEEVSVPGFLLNGNRETIAYLDANGQLVVTATRERPALLNVLELPTGRWRVSVEASSPAVRLRATRVTPAQKVAGVDVAKTDPYAAGEFLLDAQAPAMLELGDDDGAATRAVNLELTPAAGDAVEIRRLVLTRLTN
jgi:hypothetical protein